jgi:hypothetical protein
MRPKDWALEHSCVRVFQTDALKFSPFVTENAGWGSLNVSRLTKRGTRILPSPEQRG